MVDHRYKAYLGGSEGQREKKLSLPSVATSIHGDAILEGNAEVSDVTCGLLKEWMTFGS